MNKNIAELEKIVDYNISGLLCPHSNLIASKSDVEDQNYISDSSVFSYSNKRLIFAKKEFIKISQKSLVEKLLKFTEFHANTLGIYLEIIKINYHKNNFLKDYYTLYISIEQLEKLMKEYIPTNKKSIKDLTNDEVRFLAKEHFLLTYNSGNII